MNVLPSTSVSVAPSPSAIDDRQEDRERVGDDALLALEDLLRPGPGNLGPQLDRRVTAIADDTQRPAMHTA
jgi:hypothetical protein